MSFIPVIKQPRSDELLYSWIHRLAETNGLLVKDFLIEYLDMENASIATLQPDVKGAFVGLYNHLLRKPDIIPLFLSLTTFRFEALFMTEAQQTKYIMNVFSKKSRLNTSSNGLFQRLNICPECLKDDVSAYGASYMHRAHHLSGITVCPKHHCKLMYFNGAKGHACDYNLDDYSEYDQVPISADAYASYADAIFRADIVSDIKTLKGILYDALKNKRGSVTDGYSSLEKDLLKWEYNDLVSMDVSDFLKVKMITAEYVAPEELLPLFMFLYPDVDELIATIKETEDTPLVSEYHCDVCGHDYVSTPFAEENGFGCNFCNALLSEGDVANRIFETNGYSMVPPFKSMSGKVGLLHKKCGNQISITPRSFIFEGVRCRCESVISEADAKDTIAGLGNYELLEYSTVDMPCRIHAKNCGHTFEVRYRKFVKSPQCRVCFPKNMTTEYLRERIANTTDGEYELVGDFVDQNTKIKILHHTCGQITEYSPRYYHMGARCPICNSTYIDQWEKMYQLLAEYNEEFGNTNIPKRSTYKGKNLGLWCQAQRKAYQENKKTMTPNKMKKLSALGFDFKPNETEWNRRYSQYLRYITETGSYYISRRTDYEGEHLGAWVETQRKWFKTGKMSRERIEKLLNANPLLFEL